MRWGFSHVLRSGHRRIASGLMHRFFRREAGSDAAVLVPRETGVGTAKLVGVPLDLVATAAGNTLTRCALSESILTSDSSGQVRRFFELVGQSTFSSNVSADKIEVYDQVGRIVHTRDFHVRLAAGNAASGLAEFERQAEEWFIRREAFEDLWLAGRTFVYGAVNAGGMGTEGSFGPFCLVIGITGANADSATGPDDGVVFPGNTAERYVTPAGAAEEDKAVAEATEWSARMDLAVIERNAEIAIVSESEWPELVCRPDRYFEVVRTGLLPTSAISEVRINRDFLQRLRILRAQYVAGEDLTTPEQHEVAAYNSIRQWTRSGTQIVEMA